jgi:hypothetical protein
LLNTVSYSGKYRNLLKNPSIAYLIGWENEQTVQYEGLAKIPPHRELNTILPVYFSVFPDGKCRKENRENIAYSVVVPKWIRYFDFNPPQKNRGVAVLTGITLGLFSAIDIDLEPFYMKYIVVWGLVSAPIVATYIIRTYPFITNKIAPIIANIFNPLVLITLIIYLISIPIAGKDPYNDRNFLLIFNLMLLGVMGTIVFSVSEISLNKKQRFGETVLFILAIVTLLIDLIALSAIIYRLGAYGFTPNRTAVLGSNVLIIVNLSMFAVDLFKINFGNAEITKVEMTISRYLPVYAAWTFIVVFGFPLIFGMK